MTILIDADGCPVVDLTLQIAKWFGVPVIILCDTSHQIEREGAQDAGVRQRSGQRGFCSRQPGKTGRCGCDAGLRAGEYVPCQVHTSAEP